MKKRYRFRVDYIQFNFWCNETGQLINVSIESIFGKNDILLFVFFNPAVSFGVIFDFDNEADQSNAFLSSRMSLFCALICWNKSGIEMRNIPTNSKTVVGLR